MRLDFLIAAALTMAYVLGWIMGYASAKEDKDL